MIDLETLDTSPNAAILTIGAVRFNPFGNELADKAMKRFYAKIDLDSCDKINLTVSNDTIEWWSKQSKEAQEEAFSEDNRIDIVDAMKALYKFCWGSKRVWSHGAGFDIVILENIFRKIQKAYPWQYWSVRDTRTLFDMGINPNRPPILKHHALEDAWNQAVGVQNICRELQSKGIEMFKDLRNESS